MEIPEWAEHVINLHDAFREEGIDVRCEWNGERVEAVCPDIPRDIPFPKAAWFVTEGFYDTGYVEERLGVQLQHLKEYLDGH